MPTRAERPFRPIHRAVTTAVIITVTSFVVCSGFGNGLRYILTTAAITLVGSLFVGWLMYRKDIAELIRARRQG